MKKRIFSAVLALMLVVGIFGITMSLSQEAVYGAVSARTSLPSYTSSVGKAYYYTNNNIFYRNNLGPTQKSLTGSNKGYYCVGNCTWYAYARAGEILGKTFNSNFRKSASQWWSINKSGNYYPYGSTPKVGAIACYSTHVAVVEKVVNGKVYVSESGWKISKSKPTSASKVRFHYGTPWTKTGLKGYIYINDTSAATAANVDYSVKVSVTSLNMRCGPGTEYGKTGTIKPGTYKVDKQSGNWVRLSSNGHWICLKYAAKVEANTNTVVDTGTAANYSVKVSVTSLNMRSGPGTSYGKKGYLKPGTYTIVKTSNGWGKLSNNGYWIKLSYTVSVSGEYNVKITATALNMRTGPGTRYGKKGYIKPGVHTISQVSGNWGKLKSNGYWINLSYTTKI